MLTCAHFVNKNKSKHTAVEITRKGRGGGRGGVYLCKLYVTGESERICECVSV